MCTNPIRVLCKKVKYKGVTKSIIFFKTSPTEFEKGYAIIEPNDSRLSYKFCDSIKKYNLKFPITFDTRIELPCRKCLSCTRSRAKEWSLRCALEAQNYSHNYFVTLTYNDSHLPINEVKVYGEDDEDFYISYVPTLCKEHCFAFMKHLRTIFKRDYNHEGIRFFMCGEYGSKNLRPHYHFNLFNLPLDDLYLYSTSKTGHPIYRSRTLERCWKYGFVTVQPFTVETARYTAQYCCKKMNKLQAVNSGKVMEYVNMSRKGGIGSLYFLKNCNSLLSKKEGFYDDSIYLSSKNKDGTFFSSRYSCPTAFYRKLKPVTDNKRGIDTEFLSDLSFVLNNDNVTLYDAYNELIVQKSLFAENTIKFDMERAGYSYDARYSADYLCYLYEVNQCFMFNFPILRNSC